MPLNRDLIEKAKIVAQDTSNGSEQTTLTLQVLRQVAKHIDDIERKVEGMSVDVNKVQIAMATLSANIMSFEVNLTRFEATTKQEMNDTRATLMQYEKRLTSIESETKTRAAVVGGVVGVIVSICISMVGVFMDTILNKNTNSNQQRPIQLVMSPDSQKQ